MVSRRRDERQGRRRLRSRERTPPRRVTAGHGIIAEPNRPPKLEESSPAEHRLAPPMPIARFAVSRRVSVAMIAFAIVVLGIFALPRLPVDLLPSFQPPVVSVTVNYGNVSPETMESTVTRPLENAVARVAGIDYLQSNSTQGQSSVRAQFKFGTDINVAVNDIEQQVARARPTSERSESPTAADREGRSQRRTRRSLLRYRSYAHATRSQRSLHERPLRPIFGRPRRRQRTGRRRPSSRDHGRARSE